MSISNDFWQRTRKAVAINKAKGYFVLPAFADNTLTNLWKGASHILREFNFSAEKNFTLSSLPTLAQLEAANCQPSVLCIKYRIAGTVYRYKLWSYQDEWASTPWEDFDTVYAPIYNGQVIKKNFILEWWSAKVNDPGIAGEEYAPILEQDLRFDISTRHVKATLDESDDREEASATQLAYSEMTIPLPAAFVVDNPAAGEDNT